MSSNTAFSAPSSRLKTAIGPEVAGPKAHLVKAKVVLQVVVDADDIGHATVSVTRTPTGRER